MHPMKARALYLASLLAATGVAAAEPRESVYTSLDSKDCKTEKSPEGEPSPEAFCPGVMGYALKPFYGDAREDLSVLDPSGKEHGLGFTRLISHGFSSLGLKAEWRIASAGGVRKPVALIVRFRHQTQDGAEISSLAVSKITRDRICLVETIPPGPNQNAKARESADRAGKLNCLPIPH